MARQMDFDYESSGLIMNLSGGITGSIPSSNYSIYWIIVNETGKGFSFDLRSEFMDIVTDIFIW